MRPTGSATQLELRRLRAVDLFVMTLPYSGAIFIQAFPRECTETFLEGHRRAFEYFGGVPRRISYRCSAISRGAADWLTSIGFRKTYKAKPKNKEWSDRNVIAFIRRTDYRGVQRYRDTVSKKCYGTGSDRPLADHSLITRSYSSLLFF